MSNRRRHAKIATKTANRSNDKVGNKPTSISKGNKQTLLSNLISTSLKNKAVVAGVNKSQQAQTSLTDTPTLTNTLNDIETTEKKSEIMTDETNEKVNETVAEKATETKTDTTTATNIANEATETVESTEATEAESEKSVEMRTVDVVVAGSTYPVNCPVGEKEELDKVVLYINHFSRDIRKSAPSLNHENILVLCCLNMYEEMKQHRNAQASIRHQDKKVQELLDRITEDAESILDQ